MVQALTGAEFNGEQRGSMSYLRLRPDLLHSFRSGERAALAEVYRAYLPLVARLLRVGFVIRAHNTRVPGANNADDLADAIQEVFARVFRREARCAYDGTRDYAPYLIAVARNVAIDSYRRGSRERVGVSAEAMQDCSVELDHAPCGDAPWQDLRLLEIARTYVSSLTGSIRDVHTLRYVQALSQRDTAKNLGLSRPKVRKLEDRLRRELQQRLAAAGVRPEDPRHLRDDVSTRSDARWTVRPRIN